jgi:hypothetical protein
MHFLCSRFWFKAADEHSGISQIYYRIINKSNSSVAANGSVRVNTSSTVSCSAVFNILPMCIYLSKTNNTILYINLLVVIAAGAIYQLYPLPTLGFFFAFCLFCIRVRVDFEPRKLQN